MMYYRISVLLHLVCFAGMTLRADQVPTQDDLFGHYEAQIKRIRSISFTSSFTDYIESDPTKTNTLTMDWTIDFVGKRYRKLDLNELTKGSSESILSRDTAVSVSVYPDVDAGDELSTSVASYKEVPPVR